MDQLKADILRDPRIRNFRPNPTGTATEAERVQFIASLVEASRHMLLKGGKKARSPIRLLLRQAIFCFWESREFHKFDSRRPRSVMALKNPAQAVSYDHVIPMSIVADKLLTGEISHGAIREILDKWVLACVITKDEDRHLDRLGLRQEMPRDWDGADLFARYKAAGIEAPGLC
jgi:hypothetical protein